MVIVSPGFTVFPFQPLLNHLYGGACDSANHSSTVPSGVFTLK